MKLRQTLFRSLFAALVLGLSACATAPNVQPETYSLKQRVSGRGVVVGTMLASDFFGAFDAVRFNFLAPTGEEIHVLPVDGKGRFSMRVNMMLVPGGGSPSALGNPNLYSDAVVPANGYALMKGSPFALNLPPGSYRVRGLSIQRRGRWESFNQTDNMLEFSVVADEVRYLGRFMFDGFSAVAEVRDAWSHDKASIQGLADLSNARIDNVALRGAWMTSITQRILDMARGRLKTHPDSPPTSLLPGSTR